MFAIVRTGGKQYRVAAGDKIAVEKMAGEAGDNVSLDDVLLVGDEGKTKDAKGLTVSAEIIAQEKGEKVFVFKKRRRHNYRRRAGHRQQLTLLKITAIGDSKSEKKAPAKKAAAKDDAPKATEAKTEAKAETKAAPAKKAPAKKAAAPKAEAAEKKAPAKKPAAKKAAPKKTAATKKSADKGE